MFDTLTLMTKRVAKTKVRVRIEKAEVSIEDTVSARVFFARTVYPPDTQDSLLSKCSRETQIARSQLLNHVRYGVPVGRKTAKRLSDWNSEISFEKTLANS